MLLLNKPGMNMLERSLDAATMRQKVIADNIANVDTPYFKRSELRFEDYLKNEQRMIEGYRTDARHIPIGGRTSVQPEIVKDFKSIMNNNQNNVDIDYEMTQMAKNQLRYNVFVQQLNHDLRQIRTAIEGRR